MVLIATALAGCSADEADSDDDGIPDVQERAGWTVDVCYVTTCLAYKVQSDPDVADADGDGLIDVEEFLNGLDPNKADTDEDGLTDCQETTEADAQKCAARQFDCPEGDDCSTGTDASDADSEPGVSRFVLDHLGWAGATSRAGGDGIPDGAELEGYDVALPGAGSTRVRTDPRSVDSDGDGLHDGEERFRFLTNANVPDTDGDGCEDGRDIYPRQAPNQQDYRLGLWNLTLHRDADDDGDGLLQIGILWGSGDVDTIVPSGPRPVSVGATSDIRDLDPGVRRVDCPDGVPTHAPWTKMFITVADEDADPPALLALDGAVAGPVGLWWNLHTGEVALLEDRSDAAPPPRVIAGSDVTLVVAPSIDADEPAVQVA